MTRSGADFPKHCRPVPGPPCGAWTLGLKKKGLQVARVGVHPHDDVSAFPAIAAIGPAQGIEFSTVKVRRAITAVAGAGVDFDIIDKHGREGPATGQRRRGTRKDYIPSGSAVMPAESLPRNRDATPVQPDKAGAPAQPCQRVPDPLSCLKNYATSTPSTPFPCAPSFC